ncbi:STAS domain-containing protein [Streptomyces fuscigenes]|uniref:STAS domain-containing protein n=1 Tax=Streptomyces fuscigenes TaxID=1528880 RepID=UPI001F367FAF|nr:STAS domain-containing protein [Streptomyces fuscigenes]MCF3960239.1 STAS domain-containing protein [Streptomyces fuscigenes]
MGEQYILNAQWVLEVRGKLDLDTLPPLRHALESAAITHPTTILDASRVIFADSSALNLILIAPQATDLRIAAPSASLLRLFQVTGADHILRVFDSVDQAVG